MTATDGLGDYMGYSYSFSMDFGTGRFEYRMGGTPQSPSQSPVSNRLQTLDGDSLRISGRPQRGVAPLWY